MKTSHINSSFSAKFSKWVGETCSSKELDYAKVTKNDEHNYLSMRLDSN